MSESTSYWRRIVAAGVVYAAAGWGVVEALTTVVERLGLPAWLVPLVTALYIAGLPVTVFLVWRTAGEERRPDAPSFVGAMAVLVAVTAAIFWQTSPPPAEPGQLVAVLPCDFTGDAMLAYRAEGLAEDVHARLSRVGSVKISSWNSSLFVRDRGYDTPEIVELLKADRLVRCRMTSGPERIQLTAEVLDPRAGRVLWGRDYDFVAADMGTVVTELAGTLIDVLGTKAEAGERERVSRLGTFSPEAYDLYLQAQAAGSRSLEQVEAGQALVQRALEIDPNFPDALVLDARLFFHRVAHQEFESMQEPRGWIEAAVERSERALALDPGVLNARLYLARACGLLEEYFDEPCDHEQAERLREEECEIRGDTAEGWECRHNLLWHQGRDNTEAQKRWLELEPTSVDANMQSVGTYAAKDEYAKVLEVFDTLQMLAPDDPRPFGLVSNLLKGKGRLDESLAWRYGAYAKDSHLDAGRLARLSDYYLELGLFDRALELAERTWEGRRATAVHILPILAVHAGQRDRAVEVLEWFVVEIGAQSTQAILWAADAYADVVGDFPRAAELYGQALADRDLRALCEDEGCVAEHALDLVRVERGLGNEEAASAWLTVAGEALSTQAVPGPETEAFQVRQRQEALLAAAEGRGEDAVERLRGVIFGQTPETVLRQPAPLVWLEVSPRLDPVRDSPAFQALLSDFEAYLAPMQARVREADRTGDWASLRQRTYEWARSLEAQSGG